MKLFKTFVHEESGASTSEYAILVAILAVGVVSAADLFRDQIVLIFNSITSKLAVAG